MRKVKLKLKKNVINKLKIIGVVIVVLLIAYGIYNKQITNLTELGFSRDASKKILFHSEKEYIISVEDNKTLNAALESDSYKEKYLKNYAKITYQEHENLIKNINKLLDKGYSNSDVSIILTHGDDSDVTEFAKRDRVKYLEEFYEYPYAKIKYYDRYVQYSYETGEDEKTTVLHIGLNMDKKEYDDALNIKRFSYTMLVNKYHYLSENFIPIDLVEVPDEYRGTDSVLANSTALKAMVQLIEAANVEGLKPIVADCYRSYDDMVEMAEFYRKWYGDSYVENYIAKPGYSEHQTGLAFDMASATVKTFSNSEEYKWMVENAYKYGFITRFTKRGESLTGYRAEAGHFRYVGKEVAEYIYNNKITFEEYYVSFLAK